MSSLKQLAGPRRTIADSLKEQNIQSQTISNMRNIPQNKKKNNGLPGLLNRKESVDSLFMEEASPEGLAFVKP